MKPKAPFVFNPEDVAIIAAVSVRTYCDSCDLLQDGCLYCRIDERGDLVLCPVCRANGSPLPEQPQSQIASRRETPSAAIDLWSIAGWLLLLGVAWTVAHVVAGGLKISESQAPATYAASRGAFQAAAFPVLSPSRLRFDYRQAGNVIVFLDRVELEALPFPDREPFTDSLSKVWCENLNLTSRWQYALVPSVRLRDIRNGENIHSYTCAAEAWTLFEYATR